MIPTDSLSVCYFTHNELPFLRATLLYEFKWADQVCIIDMGSTDGTLEFCTAALRPQDVYVRRETNTIPKMGFAEARNAVGRLASCEWIIFSDADRIFDWNQAQGIKTRLSMCRKDVMSIETWNIPTPTGKETDPNLIERAVANGKITSVENHRTIMRRGAGINYVGYMHEEMYLGEINCLDIAEPSGLRQFHFGHWQNDNLRQLRYAWMLRRAMRDPALQRGSNNWWYQTYYPSKREDLERMADQYEKLTEGG